MTTNTWKVHDQLVEHVHSVTVVHPPHVKLITQAPVTLAPRLRAAQVQV